MVELPPKVMVLGEGAITVTVGVPLLIVMAEFAEALSTVAVPVPDPIPVGVNVDADVPLLKVELAGLMVPSVAVKPTGVPSGTLKPELLAES
jgi:hypothetical protein